jgi:hypothetical protein
MAGFREFVTGEVLTAANVDDFLAKQAVMKFADAAARDTALGTAVASGNALREGMVAWLDDDDSVIAYDGSAWNPVGAEPPAGIGSNVVQTVKTDTFTTTSATPVDITGFTLSFTPTTATSKVLIIATLQGGNSTVDRGAAFQLVRNSTVLGLGDAAGTRIRATAGTVAGSVFGPYQDVIVWLDSPATSSAITYKVQLRRTASGTATFNREGEDADGFAIRTSSTLTAIEVAA